MSLHPCVCACVALLVCMRMHMRARTFAQAQACSHAHGCICACIKHLAQSCLCPHCLCLCLSIHVCRSLRVCLCDARACVCARGVISLCLGRGIFMLLSVPPGQMQLSCLLKRDNIPNAKLETSVSICSSAHRISISSAAKSHFTPNTERPL